MTASYETAIGEVVLETNWETLSWFVEQRVVRGKFAGGRSVLVQVNRVPGEQAEAALDQGDQEPSAYPRTVRMHDAVFVIARDRIVGFLPETTPLGGIYLEWLWYALPVLCAPDGWQAVHASAVESERGVLLVCGESGSGKTTLLMTRLERGEALFSEDIVLVNREEGLVRPWEQSLHLHPHQLPAEARPGPTLDFAGKTRWKGYRASEAAEQPIGRVIFLSDEPTWLGHDADGFDSEWVPRCDADEFLASLAEYRGCRPDPGSVPEERPPRILLVNRDPFRPPTAWDGGDMTNVYGYRDGLRAAGWIAHFQPSWCHQFDGWDLVQLFHAQFPWSHDAVGALPEHMPLVVVPITHGCPDVEETAPVIRRAQKILCYSQTEIDFYREGFPELGTERFGIAPQGVPTSLYRFAEAVEPERRVFMAGRYAAIKNQTTVLQACMRLDVPITFAGPEDTDGSTRVRDELRGIAGDWKGATFLPMLRGADLWREYRRAWVHVNASCFEPFGLNSLEALASGCNIVHTASGWGVEQFRRHGSLCQPLELETVIGALATELGRPRGWHGCRPQTWEEASRQLLPIYEEVQSGFPGVHARRA